MVEPQACRCLANAVGGDTACQQQEVVSDINVPGPANEQAIYPPIAMAPANLTGESLPPAHGGDPTTGTYPLLDLLPFKEIWAVDFEFGSKPGETPEPVCLVAWELNSGRKIRQWRDQFGAAPPLPDRPRHAVRCLLRQRRNWLPSRSRLAPPATRFGLVHRVSKSHQRHSHSQRQWLAWRARAPRFGRHSHRRERRNARPGLAGGRGRTPSRRQSSTIVRATWQRWPDCCRSCCLASIFAGRWCEGAT